MLNLKASSVVFLYFSFLTIIIPNLYLFIASQVPSFDYFMLGLINPDTYFEGLAFSVISIVLFWLFASSSPEKINRTEINRSAAGCQKKWGKALLIIGYFSLTIDLLMSLVYGMPETNSSASRPYIIVLLGYFIGPLKLSVYVYLLSSLLSNRIKKVHFFSLIALLLGGGLAVGSRSTMFTLLSLFVLVLPLIQSHIRIKAVKTIGLLLVVLLSGFLGNLIRSGESDELLFLLIMRFFQNSAVLYFALSDFQAINQILLEDQPRAMLSQMFSFVFGRSILPSSVRLPEFWGQSVIESDGHMVGYAYGWLGLSYGLLKWYGLILTCAMGIILRYCSNLLESAGIGRIIIVCYVIIMINEYFFNLGLDSYVEKGFKRALFFFLLYFTLQCVASLARLSERFSHQ